MGARWTEVVVEARDPEALGAFWAAVLGWQPTGRYPGAVELAPPDGAEPTLTFVPVDHAKAAKNRLHLDLRPDGVDHATELARLLSLGARPVDVGQGPDVPWVVLADPEGNEFCLLA